jgi:ABC-type transporter Mla MlaB component
MLRISVLTHGDRSATLRLEGHISGDWIGELGDICDRLLREERALTLDLADVSMIERAGLALLAVLVSRGVSLTGCSPFQQAQLKQAAPPVCESTPPNP